MENFGSEVGQKMRSAVKAKLLELGTGGPTGYIDDELPDYVMIMVANKRSRQQMITDLNLFLGGQTELFVTWLHEVLQKLQEVTLPTANTLQNSKKRKTNEKEDVTTKKSKRVTRRDKKSAKKPNEDMPMADHEETTNSIGPIPPQITSITDVFASALLEKAKKSEELSTESAEHVKKGKVKPTSEEASRDTTPTTETNDFDIPLISEMSSTTNAIPTGTDREKDLAELAEIQKKINAAKKHLRELGQIEEMEEDYDLITLKDECSGDEFIDEAVEAVPCEPQQPERKVKSPIIFDRVDDNTKEKSLEQSASLDGGSKPMDRRIGSERRGSVALESRPVVAHAPDRPSGEFSDRRSRERERRKSPFTAESKKRRVHERLGVRPSSREAPSERRIRQGKELYVPAFRRNKSESGNESEKLRERSAERHRLKNAENDRKTLRKSSNSEPLIMVSLKTDDRSLSRVTNNATPSILDKSDSSKSSPIVRQRIGSRIFVAPVKPAVPSDDEDMLEKPVNSVVKITPRPQVPPGKQASKNLLMRAVAEAQRSTILAKSKEPKPLPAKKLRARLTQVVEGRSRRSRRRGRHSSAVPSGGALMLKCAGLTKTVSQNINKETEYTPTVVVDKGNSDLGYEVSLSQMDVDRGAAIISDSGEFPDELIEATQDEITNTQFVVTLNDDGISEKYKARHLQKRSRPTTPQAQVSSSSASRENGTKVSTALPAKHAQNSRGGRKRGKQSATKRLDEWDISTASPARNSPLKQAETKETSGKPKDIKRANSSADREEVKAKRRALQPQDKPTETGIDRSTTPPLPPTLKLSVEKAKKTPPPAEPTPLKRKHVPIKFDLSEGAKASKDEVRDREREASQELRKISIRNAEVKKYENIPALSSVSLDTSAVKLLKPKERCKYHPNCTKQFCEFYHPKAPCKSFPNCKFADKCKYSHPHCKFDTACTNGDCPFSHNGPRTLNHFQSAAPPLSSHVIPVQNYKSISGAAAAAAAAMTTITCKYYPNCTKIGCTFYHPKPCRFGRNCHNKLECNFYHHEMQSSNKFKWIATS